MKRIVLAYSGGLDTSIAIPWLAERFGAEIVTVTLDLGQDRELVDVRERALELGALRAHVVDAREELARGYVLPALRANAIEEGRGSLAMALGRPLIARRLVELARMEGTDTVAIGCEPGSADEARLGFAIRVLNPSIEMLVPAHLQGLTRAGRIEYATSRGIAVPVDGLATRIGETTLGAAFSADSNLWGRSIEWMSTADTGAELPEEIYTLTRAAEDCPDEPACVDIEFDGGVPVRANRIEMPLLELIESLDTIAGAHGVGRADTTEGGSNGTGIRRISEAPAAALLVRACRELQAIVIPRELDELAHDVGRRYADLVLGGLWFSHTREAIDAFFGAIQPRITGVVRLELFKGDCRVIGRRSPYSLVENSSAGSDMESRDIEGAAKG